MSGMLNREIGWRGAASAALTLSCLFFIAPGRAQSGQSKEQVEQVLGGLNKVQGLGPIAVSPDGTLLAHVEQTKQGWQVKLAPMSDPSRTTRVTADKKEQPSCGEGMVSWAPDSRRLAFVGNCPGGGGQDNIFIAKISGDFAAGKPKIEVEKLTDAKGEVGFPIFSPDGSRIAFLYVEGATRPAGALAAMKPWSGVIGEDGIEIQRVAVISAESHNVVPVLATPANLHVYEFDWAPDAKIAGVCGR